jgi:hypothetical protein
MVATFAQGLPMGIQLEGSANEAAQALQQGRSITYSVRLPSQNPLPVVKQITVNGHSICQENPSMTVISGLYTIPSVKC